MLSPAPQSQETAARLAKFLRDRRGPIIARWCHRILHDPMVPEAGRLSMPLLQDHVPELIDRIIASLERQGIASTGGAERGQETGRAAEVRDHGAERFVEGYSVPAAMRELSHLRIAFLDVCEADGVGPRGQGAVLLHTAIDEAMALAANTIHEAAEARVRRTEGRFQRIADAGVVGIMVVKLDGRVVEANDAFLRIVGYSRDELHAEGAGWRRITPDEWKAVDEQSVATLRATGVSPPHEKEYVHKSGHRVPVIVGAAMLEGADEAICFVLDQSERKAAEAALREQSALLDLATEAIFTHGLDGIVTFWNRGAEATYGWTRAEALGRNVHDLLKTVLPEPLEAIHGALLRDGRWQGELLHTTHDGRVLAMASRWAMETSDHGRTRRILETSADITDRKRAEESLRRANAERDETLAVLDTFMASAPVGFAVLDHALRYVRMNATLAALDGLSVEDHLGRTIYEVFPDMPANVSDAIRTVVERGTPQVGIEREARAHAAPGDVRRLLANYYPLRDGAGRTYGIGAVVVDITEQKRAAEQMQRDAELRERFLGVLSHDLKQPLGAVLFAADLILRRADLDPMQLRSAQRIAESARRMERLIADLLDLVRSRAGVSVPIAPRSFDLRDVCKQVIDEIRVVHPERTIEFIANEACEGAWDPDRIAQLVSNLVSNAVTHSPPDTPIRVEVADDGASTALLRVHNVGDPIPPELLPVLFDPFRRGARKALDSRTSAGLGLGLYIAKAIVDAHGGQIDVQSDAKHGTLFTVRLPCDVRAPRNGERG